ncbi:MAG: fasciclin domain-containing protein [Bacteroidales bacterium]|nr:fasciclin domain-containing protein [Bacteroidales bacterium]
MRTDQFLNKKPVFNGILICLIVMLSIFSSCKTNLDKGLYQTSAELMIDEYLESEDDLSLFLNIVDIADLRGMVHAYGTYTCFAPTNQAVNAYFEANGLDLASLSQADAAYMVKYHFVSDTLSTADFVESRLNAANMNNQFLTTKTELDDEGNVQIIVNRKAKILVSNVRLGNGLVHVVDHFLSLPENSVEESLMAMPDSVFSTMKSFVSKLKTDYNIKIDDYLQDTAYITLLVQTNAAFEKAEIANITDLLARLKENDLKSEFSDQQLLSNWLGYHCLPGRIYIADVLLSTTLTTSVKGQPITVSLVDEHVYLNRFKTERIDEDGIFLDRQGNYVDYNCSNGVVQTVDDMLEIIQRAAYRVYWDMGDQPEIKALKGYRKAGTSVTYQPGELSMMNWGGTTNPTVTYSAWGLPDINGAYDQKSQYVYNDYLTFRVCARVMQWLEIKTPVLVAGKYHVWICWRRMNPCKFRTTFKQEGEEDQVFPAVVDLQDYMPVELDDDQLEAKAWKQYNAKFRISVFNSKNIATIDVKTTGSHILRFDALIDSKDVGNNWDMIQFIPINDDQVWPMIAMDGTLVPKGTPDCQIFPEDGSNCPVEETEE